MSWDTKTHITSVTGASGDSDFGQDGHLYLKWPSDQPSCIDMISSAAAQRGHARSSFRQVTEKQMIHEISTKKADVRLLIKDPADSRSFGIVIELLPGSRVAPGGKANTFPRFAQQIVDLYNNNPSEFLGCAT
uniref:Uncharacterized protein n=1 Tax=Coccidioides posadasii RMSCC 3488 TaxID=454284 RepID=A0A0J6FA06_COCPO|nr:hypothetical protein CPAG_02430 [Coccidioides posadasii RMSCC 3488]